MQKGQIDMDNLQDYIFLKHFMPDSIYNINDDGLEKIPDSKNESFDIYGENKKGILIITDLQTEDVLKEVEFNFLLKVLESVKLTLQDVAVVNYSNTNSPSFDDLKGKSNDVIMIFSNSIVEAYLGASPDYLMKAKGGKRILAADTLKLIQSTKEKKMLLWNALKSLYLNV